MKLTEIPHLTDGRALEAGCGGAQQPISCAVLKIIDGTITSGSPQFK